MDESSEGMAVSAKPHGRKRGTQITRRDFLKAGTVVAGLGYLASKFPDYIMNENVGDHGKDVLWDVGDLDVYPNLDKMSVRYYVHPAGWSEYSVEMLHHGIGLAADAFPKNVLFDVSSLAKKFAAKEGEGNSTGYMNRVITAMFTEKVVARKAASVWRNIELSKIKSDDKVEVTFIPKEPGKFLFNFDEKNGGVGFVETIGDSDKLSYLSSVDYDDKVVARKPSVWHEKATNKKISLALGADNLNGISLEHTTPSAWLLDKKEKSVSMAAGYACLCAFSYSDELGIDRKLDPVERNILTTVTPFLDGREKVTSEGAEYLAGLPEKMFSMWKEKYPDLPYAFDTLLYNKDDGTFRFIPKDERLQTIKDLKENEVWMTPGEVFLLDRVKRYGGKTRFSDPMDMTLNGMLVVPDEKGEYKPVALVTTDQDKRFSLEQAESIADDVRKNLDLPDGTVFINWDKHGAGGLFVANK